MQRRAFIKKTGITSLSGTLISLLPKASAAQTNDSAPSEMPETGRPFARSKDQNIVFPKNAMAVVDVTKPPYNCDNTGKRDCTEALIRAMDDHMTRMRPPRDAQRSEIAQNYLVQHIVMGRQLFPTPIPTPRILYFPNGTYKVSDTICYSFDDITNYQHNEINRLIIIRGQSEQGVVIRLQDNCHGFGPGANKPVFSNMRGTQSNISMANYFENITIDSGIGNEGASGLRFFSNNSGAARNVTIRSGDPDKKGSVGLQCDRFNLSGSFLKNITVDGFDYGVQVLANRMYTVFEHIHLRNQRIAGFLVDENPVSIRGLRSENQVPALKMTGQAGHVVLIDSTLRKNLSKNRSNRSGSGFVPAIEHDHGVLFARNVKTEGYGAAIGRFGNMVLTEPTIEEYSSHGVFSIFDQKEKKSLNLPIEETPEVPWEQDMDQWANVNDFGAKGDGKTDDTRSIQEAINSGKKVVYFQPGQYLINGQISVPKTVQRVNFMFCNLISGADLSKSNNGTLIINEDAETPLIIEDLFAFTQFRGQHYFIEHACKRTLILSDLHVQSAGIYFNSVSGGKVYIENNACRRPIENLNSFKFYGQKVWTRQLNPESSNPQVINEGSLLWVMGFKTEGNGVGFHTSNHGSTELLGGTANIGGEANPFIVNEESSVSAICAPNCWHNNQVFREFAVEKRNGIEKPLLKDGLPKRILYHGGHITGQREYYVENYFVPLYVGR
jgi:hypothetical protein